MIAIDSRSAGDTTMKCIVGIHKWFILIFFLLTQETSTKILCFKLRGNYYSFWGQFCKKVCHVRHRPDEFTCLIACERRNSITSIRVHRSEKCASCGRAPQFALFRTARAPHKQKELSVPFIFSLYGARASVEWGDVSRDKKRLFNHNLITRGPLS